LLGITGIVIINYLLRGRPECQRQWHKLH